MSPQSVARARHSDWEPLYGEPGWSVAAGVWEVVAEFTSGAGVPWIGPEGNLVRSRVVHDADPAGLPAILPVQEYVAFDRLDGAAAAVLLDRLPEAQLGDRQNDAPSLGALLRAAARHPGEVELHGYGIGPSRSDERLTATGLTVYGMEGHLVGDDHGIDCECRDLWIDVHARFDLDCHRWPDEIAERLSPRAPRTSGWWLWWD